MRGKRKGIPAVPQEHAHDFGLEYYRLLQAREIAAVYSDDKGGITDDGQPYSEEPLNITGEQELAENIVKIENDIRQGVTTNNGN
jgi:hypothetical protein